MISKILDKPLQVLKRNSGHFVLLTRYNGENVVLKVATDHTSKLLIEAKRIEELAKHYPLMKDKIPSIITSGRVKEGFLKERCYYIQKYFPGKSLSKIIQDDDISINDITNIFNFLIRSMLCIIDEYRYLPEYTNRSLSYLKEKIVAINNEILNLPNFSFLSKCTRVNIGGKEYHSLTSLFKNIFLLGPIMKLDKNSSFISDLGHWNFHGENVLIADIKYPYPFMLIDPDIKFNLHDPIISLARFMYTFLHDTASHDQYVINSNIFNDNCKINDFNITFLWPESVLEKYQAVFDFNNFNLNSAVMPEFFSSLESCLRLKLNFIHCLLVGVLANYQKNINFVDDSLCVFQNSGIFLYLQAIIFANNIVEMIKLSN